MEKSDRNVVHVWTASHERREAATSLSPLLTSAEAAKALGVCLRTLWTLADGGQIPRVRVGSCVRYNPDDLRQWIDAQTTRGNT
jgi:excisionase family DNA binding protein